ncbi:MAG TPA: hypothetical protein VND93_13245, partial [Myxococcales bacterium]|nr:hypothetical protein [Myxococcales bacterium]
MNRPAGLIALLAVALFALTGADGADGAGAGGPKPPGQTEAAGSPAQDRADGGVCSRYAEIAGAGRVARDLIVTLPDPVTTHFGIAFDVGLDSMQRALESEGYSLKDYWLPWVEEGKAGCRDELPGILRYRSRSGDLVVRIVGESPLSGVNARVLDRALAEGGKPHRILGPTFSSSAEQLAGRLRDAGCELVLSGSATSPANASTFRAAGVPFATTVHDDESSLRTFLVQLERHDIQPSAVALLVESSTAYGQAIAAEAQSRADQDELRPEMVIPFPLHISRIREAHEKEQRDLGATVKGVRLTRESLPLGAEDPGRIRDSLPPVSARSVNSEEQALDHMLAAVARHHIEFVGVMATDPLDKVYLAEKVRELNPDVHLFSLESDVLYTHPAFARAMYGSVVISSYPLLLDAQEWTPSAPGQAHWRLQFASSAGEGLYNATLLLLHPEALSYPRAAGLQAPRCCDCFALFPPEPGCGYADFMEGRGPRCAVPPWDFGGGSDGGAPERCCCACHPCDPASPSIALRDYGPPFSADGFQDAVTSWTSWTRPRRSTWDGRAPAVWHSIVGRGSIWPLWIEPAREKHPYVATLGRPLPLSWEDLHPSRLSALVLGAMTALSLWLCVTFWYGLRRAHRWKRVIPDPMRGTNHRQTHVWRSIFFAWALLSIGASAVIAYTQPLYSLLRHHAGVPEGAVLQDLGWWLPGSALAWAALVAVLCSFRRTGREVLEAWGRLQDAMDGWPASRMRLYWGALGALTTVLVPATACGLAYLPYALKMDLQAPGRTGLARVLWHLDEVMSPRWFVALAMTWLFLAGLVSLRRSLLLKPEERDPERSWPSARVIVALTAILYPAMVGIPVAIARVALERNGVNHMAWFVRVVHPSAAVSPVTPLVYLLVVVGFFCLLQIRRSQLVARVPRDAGDNEGLFESLRPLVPGLTSIEQRLWGFAAGWLGGRTLKKSGETTPAARMPDLPWSLVVIAVAVATVVMSYATGATQPWEVWAWGFS